jgi:hypothetical protein
VEVPVEELAEGLVQLLLAAADTASQVPSAVEGTAETFSK